MPGALILIRTKAGEAVNVLDDLKKIDAIEEVEVISGDYDIMAIIRADSPNEVSRVLIEEIRKINGLKGTKTHNFISLRRVRRELL